MFGAHFVVGELLGGSDDSGAVITVHTALTI